MPIDLKGKRRIDLTLEDRNDPPAMQNRTHWTPVTMLIGGVVINTQNCDDTITTGNHWQCWVECQT